MAKAPPRLTKVQAKALGFIRSSLERTGTAPTLRELCAYMEYSAIGSAQDLVAALRRKGFLLVPQKQSARSLVLTPKAMALHEPTHQSTGDTYVIHCLNRVEAGEDFLAKAQDERIATLRMSVAMFERPYPDPEKLFGVLVTDKGMVDAGICEGDMIVVSAQDEVEPGHIALISYGRDTLVRTVAKDRQGYYFRPENASFPIIRSEENGKEVFVIGHVIALQRTFPR
jgi:repressor LexA